jgi:hypothetical protein
MPLRAKVDDSDAALEVKRIETNSLEILTATSPAR